MPPVKSVVTATSKTQFINIPRISPTGSYVRWLHELLAAPHNRKALSRSEKDAVDELFQTQAKQQFPLDNNKLKQAMNDMASKSSKSVFENMKSTFRHRYRTSDTEAVEATSALSISIPVIGGGLPGLHNRDLWKTQSYERFAQQCERQNPDTVLTKHVVDAAFRTAASRCPIVEGRDKAVLRCLGKGSTKYWRDK